MTNGTLQPHTRILGHHRRESGGRLSRSGLMYLGIALVVTLGATLALRAGQPMGERVFKQH
jgi:hypothetical protein